MDEHKESESKARRRRELELFAEREIKRSVRFSNSTDNVSSKYTEDERFSFEDKTENSSTIPHLPSIKRPSVRLPQLVADDLDPVPPMRLTHRGLTYQLHYCPSILQLPRRLPKIGTRDIIPGEPTHHSKQTQTSARLGAFKKKVPKNGSSVADGVSCTTENKRKRRDRRKTDKVQNQQGEQLQVDGRHRDQLGEKGRCRGQLGEKGTCRDQLGEKGRIGEDSSALKDSVCPSSHDTARLSSPIPGRRCSPVVNDDQFLTMVAQYSPTKPLSTTFSGTDKNGHE